MIMRRTCCRCAIAYRTSSWKFGNSTRENTVYRQAKGGTKNGTNAGPHHSFSRLRAGGLFLGSNITQEFVVAGLAFDTGNNVAITSTERAEEDMACCD